MFLNRANKFKNMIELSREGFRRTINKCVDSFATKQGCNEENSFFTWVC